MSDSFVWSSLSLCGLHPSYHPAQVHRASWGTGIPCVGRGVGDMDWIALASDPNVFSRSVTAWYRASRAIRWAEPKLLQRCDVPRHLGGNDRPMDRYLCPSNAYLVPWNRPSPYGVPFLSKPVASAPGHEDSRCGGDRDISTDEQLHTILVRPGVILRGTLQRCRSCSLLRSAALLTPANPSTASRQARCVRSAHAYACRTITTSSWLLASP